jgi:GH15 family glucan-1,4-alpha-glucosidase
VPSRIEDYALIGDCRSAALVSRYGSIDWLCFPRFDSPACFAALVGRPDNGRWTIAPVAEGIRTTRRYREGTLVLETDMEVTGGAVRLVDCMLLDPERPAVVRLVEGLRGRVEMRTELVVRFDYGWLVPWVRRRGHGIVAVGGPDVLYLQSEVELRGENLRTVGEFEVCEGETRAFVLTWRPSPAEDPPALDARAAVAVAEAWWRDWSRRCSYEGEWEEAVRRSLLTLKALTYAPTGGIVAAPTTSLPERMGGLRNWDYRF